MSKVLLFGENYDMFSEFAQKLHQHSKNSVDLWSYADANLSIDNGEMRVINSTIGKDLAEYDNILVLKTPEHDKNHIFSAIGCAARKSDIPMLDDVFSNTSGKLYEMFRFAENDLPVPDTAFGSVDFLINKLAEYGGLGVLKSTHSAQGRNNFLIKSAIELKNVLENNPKVSFILQNFIPNDGDYRIIVINFEPKMVIYRSSGGKDHRNNTSLGGSATIVPIKNMDQKILETAVTASRAMDIRLAGVDIIKNKETGEHFLLEVNRTPQLASGSFLTEKISVLSDFLQI